MREFVQQAAYTCQRKSLRILRERQRTALLHSLSHYSELRQAISSNAAPQNPKTPSSSGSKLKSETNIFASWEARLHAKASECISRG